jgi:hypothetical protein
MRERIGVEQKRGSRPSAVSAFRRQTQEDQELEASLGNTEFKASLSFIVRSCLKKQKKNKTKEGLGM